MRQPHILIAAGTEATTRVLLTTCRRLRDAEGVFPAHVYALGMDGDEATRGAFARAGLPADRVPFVPLSVVQVREALALRKEEMKDGWREGWQGLVQSVPDNGACMIPALGRLMVKAARPAIVQHLRAFKRRIDAAGGKEPEVWIVFSPVSGTSRGSVVDLPRYVRAVFPEAILHGVVVHPVGIETLDPEVSKVYQTNFIEALRLLEHETRLATHRVFADDQKGWEELPGRVLDDVFAFDHRYGNLRLRQLGEPRRLLSGGLSAVLERVVDLLAGVVGADPLYERMRSRLADAEMHRAGQTIGVQRTAVFAVHEARSSLDREAFRRALLEHAVARLSRSLASARRAGGESPLGTEPATEVIR